MELNQSRRIVNTLAQGIHPTTGEVFPSESPYNDPEVIRALFSVLESIKYIRGPKKTTEERRRNNLELGRPKNSGIHGPRRIAHWSSRVTWTGWPSKSWRNRSVGARQRSSPRSSGKTWCLRTSDSPMKRMGDRKSAGRTPALDSAKKLRLG